MWPKPQFIHMLHCPEDRPAAVMRLSLRTGQHALQFLLKRRVSGSITSCIWPAIVLVPPHPHLQQHALAKQTWAPSFPCLAARPHANSVVFSSVITAWLPKPMYTEAMAFCLSSHVRRLVSCFSATDHCICRWHRRRWRCFENTGGQWACTCGWGFR